jgi:hypothetical protein
MYSVDGETEQPIYGLHHRSDLNMSSFRDQLPDDAGVRELATNLYASTARRLREPSVRRTPYRKCELVPG